MIKGRVGAMTYYTSKGQQIVRQSQNNSNYGDTASRSEAQQANRVRWANLVNFYKSSSVWMKKAFESKRRGQTDYNKLMSVNLTSSRIYLTKDEANAGCCIIYPYIVSQGSLPSIEITTVGGQWKTDIMIGDIELSSQTKVSEFSAAILQYNSHWREGDQISFISYQQNIDSFGRPRAICTAYELTLDLTDARKMRDFLPYFCSSKSEDGFLGTSTDISVGGFTYMQSRNANNSKLQVSSQQLVGVNQSLILDYSSEEAKNRAILSYGVQEDAFLDTGSAEQEAAPQPVFITRLSAGSGSIAYGPNSAAPKASTLMSAKPYFFDLSVPVKTGDISGVLFVYNQAANLEGSANNTIVPMDAVSVVNGRVSVDFYDSDYEDWFIAGAVLTYKGSELVLSFEPNA